MGSYPDQIQKL